MVLNICKNNSSIFNIFILLETIGGFFNAMKYFGVLIMSHRVTKNYIFSSKFLFMKFVQRCLDLVFHILFCFVTFFPGAPVHTPIVICPKPILGFLNKNVKTRGLSKSQLWTWKPLLPSQPASLWVSFKDVFMEIHSCSLNREASYALSRKQCF